MVRDFNSVVTRQTYLQFAETPERILRRMRSVAETLDIAERQRIVQLLVKKVLVGEDEMQEFESSFVDTCLKHLTSGYATLDKRAKTKRLATRWNLWVPGKRLIDQQGENNGRC